MTKSLMTSFKNLRVYLLLKEKSFADNEENFYLEMFILLILRRNQFPYFILFQISNVTWNHIENLKRNLHSLETKISILLGNNQMLTQQIE